MTGEGAGEDWCKMTGAVLSDVPLWSPGGGKTHSPLFLWQICQEREVIRRLQRHYVCWITFFMPGKVHIFSLMCILRGRKPVLYTITSKLQGLGAVVSSHATCSMTFGCNFSVGYYLTQGRCVFCLSVYQHTWIAPLQLLNLGPQRPQKEIAAVDGSVTSQGTNKNTDRQVKNTECIL